MTNCLHMAYIAITVSVYVVVIAMHRDNLEWLARATNWAKFTATASLGVIHKVSDYTSCSSSL